MLALVAACAPEERGHGGEEPTAVIRGTVSGPNGTLWCVRIFAIVGERIIADTGSDPEGRYEVEVPAGHDVVLELRPDPAIGLSPKIRTFRLEPGARVEVDFALDLMPSASGHVEGLGLLENATLLAIRVEDLPDLPEDPVLAANALDGVPKLHVTTTGGFVFKPLDPEATYRLLPWGFVWALDDTVLFRAGDRYIVARLRLAVPWSVTVLDMEGKPLRRFTARLVDTSGEVRDTLEGRDGHARRGPNVSARPYCPPWGLASLPKESRGRETRRSDLGSFLYCWKVAVSAAGYQQAIFDRWQEGPVRLRRAEGR